MKRSTLFVVLALTLALGFLVWRERAREGELVSELEVPLAPGIVEDDIVGVRVESVARGVHARFERGPDGRFAMIDPLRMAAEDAQLLRLVRGIVARTAVPVPDADPRKLGFEPPSGIVDLALRDGRKLRVEVGAADLDRTRAFLRVDGGRILSGYRDLYNALDVDLDEYKSHAATSFEVRDVVEIRRTGTLERSDGSGPVDLALDALAEDGVWRATAPVAGALDPLAASSIAALAAQIRIDRYVDEVGRSHAELGLDPPLLTLRVGTARSGSAQLRFGRYGGAWTCAREGVPYVWSVDPSTVLALFTPVEELLDAQLVRFVREEVDGVDLASDRAELRLRREGRDWLVSEARPGSTVFGAAERADAAKVSDLLGALERTTLDKFVREPAFTDAEARASIRVRARGATAGGRIGADHVDASGARAVRFQRDGDGFVALTAPALLDLARASAADFVALELLRVPEVDLVDLRLQGAGRELRYARDGKGIWRRYGGDLEARELGAVLDGLVFLRAEAHLAPEPRPALEEPIEVTWLDRLGAKTSLVIALVEHSGERRAVAEIGGRRSLLRSRDLHAKLAALLAAG